MTEIDRTKRPFLSPCRRTVLLRGRQVQMGGSCLGHADCREAYWRDHDHAEALVAARGTPRFKRRHADR